MIRRAGVDDLDQVAEVLGVAFSDYPWTRWCVDSEDHVRRITQLQRISLEQLGIPHGLVWVSELGGVCVSGAVWTDSRVNVDREIFQNLADRSRPLHGDRLSHAVAAEGNGFPRPIEPHLFLETMGTRPDHWRKGHGARVLGPGLALADEQHLMSALETSTEGNVTFYQSAGFEIIDHRAIPDGGPDVWTMWRSPDNQGTGR